MISSKHRDSSALIIRITCSLLIPACLLLPASAQNRNPQTSSTKQPAPNIRNLPKGQATQQPTKAGNHNADTKTGRLPSSSGMSTGEKAAIIGGIAAVVTTTAILVHNHEHKLPSKDDLMKNGPKVPENVSMSHLIVDGVIGPNWPVGLDFQLQGPGTVTLDITTAENVQYHQVLVNDLHGRGITITRPTGLPDKLQSATFDIEAKPPAGSTTPPSLHIYGLAAGPHAVGSIAIDEVKFGPSSVKKKDPAQYGFHSHSDFSTVRADFMWTGLKDQRIVMKQDSETSLNPVGQGEQAQGSFQTKGSPGEHYLQIRAWRGSGGDWVVAWSPDIVTLQK